MSLTDLSRDRLGMSSLMVRMAESPRPAPPRSSMSTLSFWRSSYILAYLGGRSSFFLRLLLFLSFRTFRIYRSTTWEELLLRGFPSPTKEMSVSFFRPGLVAAIENRAIGLWYWRVVELLLRNFDSSRGVMMLCLYCSLNLESNVSSKEGIGLIGLISLTQEGDLLTSPE